MVRKDIVYTNEQMRARLEMRTAYNTKSGRAEFLRILVDHGVFDETGPEKLPLRNWAIAKLEELGFLDVEVLEKFIDWAFDNTELSYRMTVEELEASKGQ
jgi:hypothetical protein